MHPIFLYYGIPFLIKKAAKGEMATVPKDPAYDVLPRLLRRVYDDDQKAGPMPQL